MLTTILSSKIFGTYFPLFLLRMQTIDTSHFAILQLIYSIVKDDSHPLKCKVHPRDLILRSMQDWSLILSSLKILEEEELITMKQLEVLQIALTQRGFDMCHEAI